MLVATAVCAMLGAFHGGTTTGGTSTGGTSSSDGSSSGTTTGAGTTGATSSTTTQGETTTGASQDSTGAGETNDLETSPPAEGDEAPSESSDAGVDPTFGPLDATSTDALDDDGFGDGCCDHSENNSDNFLCRISPGHFDRIALAVVLLLLGRPRKRSPPRTRGKESAS